MKTIIRWVVVTLLLLGVTSPSAPAGVGRLLGVGGPVSGGGGSCSGILAINLCLGVGMMGGVL